MYNVQFAYPALFWLLLLLPLWAWWLYKTRKSYYPNFKFSSLQSMQKVAPTFKTRFRWLLPAMRMLALACIIVALARPRLPMQSADATTEGIDIVLSLDFSMSMMSKDFEPNRLEVAKQAASEFIDGRPTDRIGLVAFGGESYTACPLTTDHLVLKETMKELEAGHIDGGTAIGLGIASGCRALKNSQAKSKVIILLTDGVNNAGYITPTQATETAKALGFRVYTIGVGTKGEAMSPIGIDARGNLVYEMQPVEIDEMVLTYVADQTGGRYFRATDINALKSVYAEIDKLERSKIKSNAVKRYEERFHPWLFCALLFLAVELGLSVTVFKTALA